MKQEQDRKYIAKKRVRGLLVFLIAVSMLVLFYDVYLLIKGWF